MSNTSQVHLASDRAITRTGATVILLVACIYLLGFEFKAPKGSDPATAANLLLVLPVIIVSFFAGFVLTGKNFLRVSGLELACSCLFLVVSVLRSLARGHDPYLTMKNGIPLLLLISGLCSAAYLYSRIGLKRVIQIAVAFAIVSICARVLIVGATTGFTLNTVRYQILSGGVYALPAAAAFMLLRPPTLRLCALVAAGVTVAAMSVTRTILVSFVACYAVAFAVAKREGKLLRLVVLSSVAAAALAMALSAFADGSLLIDRWFQRLFGYRATHNVDLTLLARQAELGYQIDRLVSDPATLVLGEGLGARTSFRDEERAVLARLIGRDTYNEFADGFGHNTWVSAIFLAGLPAGALLAFAVFRRLAAGLKQIALNRVRSSSPHDLMPVLLLASIVAASFFSGVLGDRAASFLLGLSLGLVALTAGSAETIVSGSFPKTQQRGRE